MSRNWIPVKEDEKRLYRICKELELNGISKIDKTESVEWNSTLRKFGVRAKPLIEKGILEPILKPDQRDKLFNNRRVIMTKKDVEIKEVTMGNNTRFYFKEIEKLELHKKRRRLI